MSEEPGEDEPPSFEERLKAARGRQGLDAPPPLSARDSGDIGGMSPWGIGLRVGSRWSRPWSWRSPSATGWIGCSAPSPS